MLFVDIKHEWHNIQMYIFINVSLLQQINLSNTKLHFHIYLELWYAVHQHTLGIQADCNLPFISMKCPYTAD